MKPERATEARGILPRLSKSIPFATVLAGLATAHAAVHYVDLNSPNPTPPFTNWATAAKVIQTAVDAAVPGEEILVTNGIYASGGRAAGTNILANRVAVDRPLTVRSVNGPGVTVIVGYQVPGVTNGDGAVRCVYLADKAVLSGFTLTNGATGTDWQMVLDTCGGGVWCESTSALVTNCTLSGNAAWGDGSGAWGGMLKDCLVSSNLAEGGGGGAAASTLYDCTLSGNSAYYGGGANGGTLFNCALTGNSAYYGGGGACEATLTNCTLSGNSAGEGGGANGGTLLNCALTGNSAEYGGGGVQGGTLTNCTLSGNWAGWGGGALSCTLNNCIVYDNTAQRYGPNYWDSGTLNYCCTTPLPSGGSGNLTNDPALASAWRLSADSPCRGAGSAAYTVGVDLDGESWLNPPSIGCDEYYTGSITGALSVAIVASWTNVARGFAVDLRGLITGRASATRWEFGDGTMVSNRLHTAHAWLAPGDYVVVLRAYNQSYPAGVTANATIHVVETPVYYVDINSGNPAPPFGSWTNAATNIQDAVDAAWAAGALVLVSNGVYQAGGRAVYGLMTNRVAVDKPLTVRSVNGPEVTVIEGYQVPGVTNGGGAVRCVYLTNGAVLSGFTLTKGATVATGGPLIEGAGGGVLCESTSALITNCTVNGNSAYSGGGGAWYGTLNHCTLSGNSAYFGGGAYEGTLYDCTLTGNSAVVYGGGAYGGTLNYCTVSSNSGGGVYGGTLNYCTLTGNTAGDEGGGARNCTLYYCTLSTNSAYSGGGASGGTLNYCTLTGNIGRGVSGGTLNHCTLTGNVGGGAYGGTLNDCTLTGNVGSGASEGTLNDCTLTGNSGEYGGGVYGAILNHCTVSSNTASYNGGAAYNSTLYDCTLTGNSAVQYGGGSYAGTLNNCTLTGNSAGYSGGGANGGTLNNCTLTGNRAVVCGGGAGAGGVLLFNCTVSSNSVVQHGGGVSHATLINCIVYNNTAGSSAPNWDNATFNYCCTTPLPTNGVGNITSPPLFVDEAGGNLRLQTNSPCINAGKNAAVAGTTDRDGRPRIVGGTVDMGAYEYQGPGLGEFLGWLQQYGLATDGSADYGDSDGEGLNNWQEWCCRTDPTNALSALRLVSAAPAGTNVIVRWQSVAGVTYYLVRSTNLCAWPPFGLLATNLAGQAGMTAYTDTDAARLAPVYYRVGVGNYIAPTSPPAPTLVWHLNRVARTLQLSWSEPGFRLQAQTNSLGVGATAKWFDYPGGGSSPVTVPIDPASRATYYRLVWP